MKKLLLLVVLAAVAGYFLIGRNDEGVEMSKELVIKGSDTEVQVVSNLVEAFIENNPDANISVTGGGSGVGIAALLNQEIDVANSSRKIKDSEVAEANEKGIEVHEFVIARDGLTVIVHPDNPLSSIAFEDVGKLFGGESATWKDVGGSDEEVVLYGRQSTSGTYVYFRDTAVQDDYASSMRNMEGNQAIVEAVANDVNGIGYVGVGYINDEEGTPREDIKVVSIKVEGVDEPVSPFNLEAIKSGAYPLARPLYQYLPSYPEIDSLLHKFLEFQVSEEGQQIVSETGFFPITTEDEAVNKKLFEGIAN